MAHERAITTAANHPDYLALDDTHVYWTASAPASVQRAPKTGGAMQIVAAPSGASPWKIAVDADHVYWTDQVGNTIGRAPSSP